MILNNIGEAINTMAMHPFITSICAIPVIWVLLLIGEWIYYDLPRRIQKRKESRG